MHGRATPTRTALPRWSAQDFHGDSEIPRPSDEQPEPASAASPVTAPSEPDHRSEFWHG